jgi:hypothetical protein
MSSSVLASRRATIVGALAVLLLAVTARGLPYYAAGAGTRVRSPLHSWLRPSGYIGQAAGIIAFLIFVFLWLYPLRKKFRWLAFTGAVGRWLDVHVAAALLMPLLVGVHAGWRFEGLIGLGFAAILVVCASGVIGRYLYTRIPRTKSGTEMDLAQVTAERRSALTEICAATRLTPSAVEQRLAIGAGPRREQGLAGAFAALIRSDITRWRAVRRFRAELTRRGNGTLDPAAIRRVTALASREASLAGQVRMLDVTHRIFRLWHVAHRPVAITALIAVTVHVAVVVALGTSWFW